MSKCSRTRASNPPSRLALTIPAMRRSGMYRSTYRRRKIAASASRLCQKAKISFSPGALLLKAPGRSSNRNRMVTATARIKI